MSAPLKLKGHVLEIVEEQADLRARTWSYKDIHRKTGLSKGYLATVISALARAKRELLVVSRETNRSHNRES